MNKIRNLALLFCCLSSTIFTSKIALANDFTVQIGAYKYLSQRIINQAERYGQVFQSNTRNNLTRVQVGTFQNRSQAKNVLNKLKSAGFSDAYITRLYTEVNTNTYSAPTYNSTTTSDNYSVDNTSNRASSLQLNDYYGTETTTVTSQSLQPDAEITFDNLTEDEKSKATYLDDSLRIFENGEFMTVSQYRNLR